MAQRLGESHSCCNIKCSLIGAARRFDKQIFISLDLPPGFMTMGKGMGLTLEVEKYTVQILKNLEVNRT